MSTSNRTRAVEEALELDDVERVMYLSLVGADAWRLYRQGMHTALLLEMFAVDETFDVFLDGIEAVLVGVTPTPRFADLLALGQYIDDVMQSLPELQQRQFRAGEQIVLADHVMDALTTHERAESHAHVEQLADVDRVATFMLDVLYRDAYDVDATVKDAVTGIWFTMCDAAWGTTSAARTAGVGA